MSHALHAGIALGDRAVCSLREWSQPWPDYIRFTNARDMMHTVTPRLIGSLFFAAIASSSSAQSIEWADARTYQTRMHQALPVGGGQWAVMGTRSFAGAHGIAVYTSNGQLVWEDWGPYMHGGTNGQVVLMPDSGLLHAGALDGCDVFTGESRVRRYSAAGGVLWQIDYEMNEWMEGVAPFIPAKGISDKVAVVGSRTVVLNLDGQLLSEWPTPIGMSNVRLAHWMEDSALLYGFQGFLKKVDAQGNTVASVATVAPPLDVHVDDADQVFMLDQGALRLYDSDLNAGAVNALLPGHVARAIHSTNDGIFVSSDAGLYRFADGALEWLFGWPPLENTSLASVAVRDGQLLTVGNSHVNFHFNGLVRAWPLDGAPDVHDEDVEVLLQVDSTWSEYAFAGYYRRKANMVIRVVNYGSAVLERVAVSSFTGVPWVLCDIPGLHVELVGLGLAPGDTAVAWSGTHVVHQATSGSGTSEICVAATSPNSKADRQPVDNYTCVTSSFTVGVAERDQALLVAAPNPARGACLVQGADRLGTTLAYALMDRSGRTVGQGSSVRGDSDAVRIPLEGIVPGMYVLELTGSGGRARTKLMVE